MDRYPPIAEHGLIGDLQTAALVTTNGIVVLPTVRLAQCVRLAVGP
jgi:hypothetical protein